MDRDLPPINFVSIGPIQVPQIPHLVPTVEVWRSGAIQAQAPGRRGLQWDPVYITGLDPVVIRLQFGSQAAGKGVAVTPGTGITVDPPTGILQVGSTGERSVTVGLHPESYRGQISFYCDGMMTTLRLSRAPEAVVVSKETYVPTPPRLPIPQPPPFD
jgi:hypothetical protein